MLRKDDLNMFINQNWSIPYDNLVVLCSLRYLFCTEDPCCTTYPQHTEKSYWIALWEDLVISSRWRHFSVLFHASIWWINTYPYVFPSFLPPGIIIFSNLLFFFDFWHFSDWWWIYLIPYPSFWFKWFSFSNNSVNDLE